MINSHTSPFDGDGGRVKISSARLTEPVFELIILERLSFDQIIREGSGVVDKGIAVI